MGPKYILVVSCLTTRCCEVFIIVQIRILHSKLIVRIAIHALT